MPTPVSFGVIIACLAVLLLGNVSPALALWPLESGMFYPWQVVTYSFLHANFSHLFFNMFAVWMFGTQLEQAWGTNRFSVFYMTCVIGAALIQIAVQLLEGGIYPTIGASGGVFGLLLAYGVTWPRNKIFLLFLPVPIEARWFVLIYGAFELLFGVT
ncbi:MAG: rhomboid family intramembrane serine protease, partial [Xanthomonadales bacterium]|nr:rhomboid family intramembrane serine protease [Xanthomonadales bacterium]